MRSRRFSLHLSVLVLAAVVLLFVLLVAFGGLEWVNVVRTPEAPAASGPSDVAAPVLLSDTPAVELSGLLARHFGDHTAVAGYVRNICQEPLEKVRVEARLLDANGGVIELAQGVIQPLRVEPGQRAQFDLRMSPSPEARSVNVQFYVGGNLLPHSEVR